MLSNQSFGKMVPFEDHNAQIQNSILEYGEVVSGAETYSNVLEEVDGDHLEVHGDLEYLTSVRFLEKELNESGEEVYSLTETADGYLERFKDEPSISVGNDRKMAEIKYKDRVLRLERDGATVLIYENEEEVPAGDINTMSGEIAAKNIEDPDLDRIEREI